MDWLLDRLFRLVVVSGNLRIITARGAVLSYGDGEGHPVAIRFTSSAWQWATILDPELRVGEAFMYGGLVVEQGSIAAFLDLMTRNISSRPPVPWSQVFAAARHLRRCASKINTLRRASRNSKHHYDIDERIYRIFLDSDMQYSCAYFEDEHETLEQAQEAKKRHISAKLNLNRDRLRVMLLHTVGRLHGPADTNAWVWKYIFPGGHAPALSELAPIIEGSGLVLTDVEVLRLHYADTLRHWRNRFLAHREEALRVALSGEFKHFIRGETFLRMWECYLAGFEASFRNFGLCVFQIQLAKKLQTVPTTRDYLYDQRQAAAVARRSASLRLV